MGIYKIAVLPGDGIGPEVTCQTVDVIKKVAKKYGHKIMTHEGLIGGCAIDTCGVPLPEETVKLCRNSNAVLLGAVGGPKWDNMPGNIRPEAGLLGIRSVLGLYANLRPAVIYPALLDASPLKTEIISSGIDIMVVRELTGGIYFGKRGRYQSDEMGETAFDTESYSESEIKRIARVAFEAASKRGRKVMSVDKANVLESSRLWRQGVVKLAEEYPDIELSHMYVDNAAMQLVRNPAQFDVIVTSNMFGDILSDEASMITGSIGMLPSASLGVGSLGLYEPVHGSAPDIAGMNKANPLASILSGAMLLRYSLGLNNAADDIESAVKKTLDMGYRTSDIGRNGENILGTSEIGSIVNNYI